MLSPLEEDFLCLSPPLEGMGEVPSKSREGVEEILKSKKQEKADFF